MKQQHNSCKSEKSCACEKECGSCQCGSHMDCKCKMAIAKCVTMLASSALIAGTIYMTNCPTMAPVKMPKMNAKTVNVDAQIRKFVETNPKVIIDSVEKFYKAQQPAPEDEESMKKAQAEQEKTIAKHLPSIINDKTNHSLGNPNGKFVIVEFFDYNCGWCKKTNQAMWEAINSDKGKNIRWILMDSPIFGENSEMISRYVLAAGEQGKFAEMHHAVASSTAKLDENAIVELAKKHKLNVEKLKADATSQKVKDKIAANQKVTAELGVRGVPFLIVNGKANPGALIGERLDTAIAESNK